ncbi:MAG: hypothetical protein EPN48_13090 [Microbacteriaceae bacterium]|nr:MAG: hypothetical protein EPN48_13090 [Microbacteriaceae bacterium]
MIVGIDLGGTKTHVIAEDNGSIVLDVAVPTPEWQTGALLEDESNPHRLLTFVGALIGSSASVIAIGARDLDSEQQVQSFSTRVQAEHDGEILVVNDVELLAPAAGLDDAIAVIVGTGSKIVGHDAGGDVISAGGHGFLIDDEGSAPWIAREAMRAVLDADDRGEQPDMLAQMLMQYFGVEGVVEAGHAFASMVGLNSWARLCPLVFQAADRGSQLAASVVTDAAAALAQDVALVHRRGAVGTNVLCAGGVITHQPRLYQELVRSIEGVGIGLTVRLLTVPPVMGALALARKLRNKTTAK